MYAYVYILHICAHSSTRMNTCICMHMHAGIYMCNYPCTDICDAYYLIATMGGAREARAPMVTMPK